MRLTKSRASIAAPAASNLFTSCLWPFRQAQCKAVRWSWEHKQKISPREQSYSLEEPTPTGTPSVPRTGQSYPVSQVRTNVFKWYTHRSRELIHPPALPCHGHWGPLRLPGTCQSGPPGSQQLPSGTFPGPQALVGPEAEAGGVQDRTKSPSPEAPVTAVLSV